MKKKFIVSLIVLSMVLAGLAGCGGGGQGGETPPAVDEPTKMEGPISVISREDGSGTRGAFVELMGIEKKDDSGKKVDRTVVTAEICNSTSVVLMTVANNKSAIGYISLGSLNDTVKALEIDGVAASVDNIKSGKYGVARPFNIATLGNENDVTKDFIAYIMSAEGQAIVESSGYISAGNDGAYSGGSVSGKVTVGGSSSVTPVMEKLVEGYTALNPDVTIEVQMSDSTSGMTGAKEGILDIGMASRELKDSELADGLVPQVIAMDGIAVIVNLENSVEGLSADQVLGIYIGDITEWDEVSE